MKHSLAVILGVLLMVGSARAQPPEKSNTPDPNEKIQLRLRLKPGQSFTVNLTTDQTLLQAVPGFASDVQQMMDFHLGMRLLSIDDDGALNIETTYRSIRMKVLGQGIDIEYDSENPPAKIDFKANPAAAMIAAMFGSFKAQVLTVKLAPTGQVHEVKGMEESWTRMLQAIKEMELPREEDRQMITKMLEGMKTQFGTQTKNNVNTTLAIFSDKPVGIGDSWRSPAPIDKESSTQTDTIYILKARAANTATVAVGSQLRYNTPPGMFPTVAVQELNLSGTQIGIVEIDEATGITKRGDLQLLLTGSIAVKAGDQEEPMTIPFNSKTTIRITSTEDAPVVN